MSTRFLPDTFLFRFAQQSRALALLPALCACAALTELPESALADPGAGTERAGGDFSPKSFAYVLQADKLEKSRSEAIDTLATCDRDLIIIDTSLFGDEASEWSVDELDRVRKGKPGRRILAYFSVGEAESYRSYWDPEWELAPPPFLLEENTDWEGNFRVKYWSREWQGIILKQSDRLIAQGFDGIYLDIVDAFEGFEYDPAEDEWDDHRINGETGNTYREDMMAWVARLCTHTRAKRAGFLVIPQNGDQLLANADYRAAIDGIGVEDLFSDGRKAVPKNAVRFRLGFLDLLKADGKPVLCVDYSKGNAANAEVGRRAHEKGFVLLITDRNLRTIGQMGSAP